MIPVDCAYRSSLLIYVAHMGVRPYEAYATGRASPEVPRYPGEKAL
jgi:hypothetical protein